MEQGVPDKLIAELAGHTNPARQVYGIDPSAEMIAVARHKAERLGLGIDYRVGVIEALPLADATFDVVLSSPDDASLPADLEIAGLREVRRVLKPGGHLLILDIKRPKGLPSRLSLLCMTHAHVDRGVEDLEPLLGLLVARAALRVLAVRNQFSSPSAQTGPC